MSMDSLDAMKAEAMAKADQVDAARDEAMMAASPVGDFSVSGLNKVVAALNSVLPSFGVEEPYPEFAVDTEELPPEFMNQLTMVAEAAKDAMLEDVLSMADLEVLQDDRDLQLLAGKLRTLGESRDFKQFLAQPSDEAVAEVEEAAVEEPMVGPADAAEDDDLLMQRM